MHLPPKHYQRLDLPETLSPPSASINNSEHSRLAISTGAPPNGGGGASPVKWLSFMSTQPALGLTSSVIVGQQAIAQSLGPFAVGDLYVVAVFLEADTGVTGTLSISGSGWTNLVYHDRRSATFSIIGMGKGCRRRRNRHLHRELAQRDR